jgi:ABC-type spermidine/putrescine transport system permease subunit II
MERARLQDGWVGRAQLSVAVIGAAFLLLPLLIIFPMAFSDARYLTFPPPGYSLALYRNLFSSDVWLSAIAMSFQVAVAAALVAVALGVPAAYAIVRFGFLGRQLLYALLLTPLVVPVIIIALSLFLTFAPIGLTGNPWALALGHSLLGIPFVVVMTTSVLRDFDINLERAAQSLGASGLRTFAHVTFPGIRAGVLLGAFSAFAISFDEVVLAIFIGGRTANTLPRQIWGGITTSLDPVIPAVSALLIVAVFVGFTIVWLRQVSQARLKRRATATLTQAREMQSTSLL